MKLYLIPVGLTTSQEVTYFLPQYMKDEISNLDYFIVENAKTARIFLKQLVNKPIQELRLVELNQHTSYNDLESFIQPLLNGKAIGLMSDAGCPGVADPGAKIVQLAHRNHIDVIPLIGPSSILLSLMASGLNGQQFEFHGYLPTDNAQRERKLLELSKSAKYKTHLFIETPYRNTHLFETILKICPNQVGLCIASNLTDTEQYIKTQSILEWKKQMQSMIQKEFIQQKLHKIPVIFLLGNTQF